MARDSQRSKLYKAEQAAFRGHVGRDVSTEAKFQARVDAIVNSEWMQDTVKSGVRSKVTARYIPQKRHKASSYWCAIEYGPGCALEWVLVHELAHIVMNWTNRYDQPHHGWMFASIYLEMVGRFIGVAERDALKASFKKHRVKYKKPKQLSDEQRAALADRLRKIKARSISPGLETPALRA